jgi:hypothetical protein
VRLLPHVEQRGLEGGGHRLSVPARCDACSKAAIPVGCRTAATTDIKEAAAARKVLYRAGTERTNALDVPDRRRRWPPGHNFGM